MKLRDFHEWPLVALTSLAIPAAGVFAARMLAHVLAGAPPAGSSAEAVATLALFSGLMVSLAHLGRPARAPLAVLRTGRSMLSTEVVLASALLVSAVVGLLPAIPGGVRDASTVAAGWLALALLLALGLVYFLPSRWPWRTSLVAVPLTSGLAAGATALACGSAPSLPLLVPLVALGVDAVLFAAPHLPCQPARAALPPSRLALRRTGRRASPPGYALMYPEIAARRQVLVALRLLLVNLVPAGYLLAHLPAVALVSILAGLAADRFAFYGLAAAQSTEAEMARVDALIG